MAGLLDAKKVEQRGTTLDELKEENLVVSMVVSLDL
jgi:hypothetical protein